MGQVSRCGRCKVTKPNSEFYWSKGNRNAWCKTCYKDWYRETRIKRLEVAERQKRKRTEERGGRVVGYCEWCGSAFETTGNDLAKRRKFCSRECGESLRERIVSEEILVAKEKIKRCCLHCGCEIAPKTRIDAAYCSDKCNQAAHHLARKFAGRAGTERRRIHRAELGERDNWTCQICGNPVDRDLEHPDPMCPSLDHILPLARGGTNDLENLQLTHLRCNLIKHDRVNFRIAA